MEGSASGGGADGPPTWPQFGHHPFPPAWPGPQQHPPPTAKPKRPRRGLRIAGIAAVCVAVAVIFAIAAVIGRHAESSSSGGYGNPVELPFTGLHQADHLAVDPAGNVYVSDQGGNSDNGLRESRIFKLAAGSASQTALPLTGLHRPMYLKGIAVDSAGNVYAADERSVFRLTADAAGWAELPEIANTTIAAVALDKSGSVYVADDDHNRVLKLTEGTTRWVDLRFTGLQIISPLAAVAVDTDGNLYVTDGTGQGVFKLAKDATSAAKLPVHGLTDPAAVTVDNAGNVYFTANHPRRVIKLPGGGPPPTELPATELSATTPLAVDAVGNVYMIGKHDRVLKLPAK